MQLGASAWPRWIACHWKFSIGWAILLNFKFRNGFSSVKRDGAFNFLGRYFIS